MSKSILVFGATGRQGESVVQALCSRPSFTPTEYTILAVTRNLTSDSAQRLTKISPAVKLVEGDLHNARRTFEGLPMKPWGVYAVTVIGKREVEDGIAIATEASKAGVSHFVFSSVDRGPVDGGNSPTNVPHFATKHKIETRIRELAELSGGKFSYTILRPPFFLSNIDGSNSLFTKAVATMWKDCCHRPLSVIDPKDIGLFVASAFMEHEKPQYHNSSLNIASDRLTYAELDAKFRVRTGKPFPTTYSSMVSFFLWVDDDLAKMARFFQDPGFVADPNESRKTHKMTSVDEWLDQLHM